MRIGSVGHERPRAAPDIAALPDVRCVVVRGQIGGPATRPPAHSASPHPLSEDVNGAIFGRILTPDGSVQGALLSGDAVRIDAVGPRSQIAPEVTALPNGGVALVWSNTPRQPDCPAETDMGKSFHAIDDRACTDDIDLLRDQPARGALLYSIAFLTTVRIVAPTADGTQVVMGDSGGFVSVAPLGPVPVDEAGVTRLDTGAIPLPARRGQRTLRPAACRPSG